ncbi:malto-oligosyltrehalose trehalohydrolase [Longimicrobium sp.]|uniref:malto-oligosyltrehalose trehalohydrolase n=1 Tax=Longimicrobium sp. TaxID=2029185 RepID=UPI002CADCD4D|nr:malto-oligosyltrehalose trehalohydrolase [Longimicrobium sp.]HSU16928.1 malto-oligosyltrehalose trehalohydrolase [Longimicrobium sp.]
MGEGTRWRLPFGANVSDAGTGFRVWAPGHERVDVVLYGPDAEAVHPLEAEDGGWFGCTLGGAGAGARYRYRLDGGDAFPDPASRAQPGGVHDPSEVVDPSAFAWTDEGWQGVEAEDLVIYELHVGTFTPEGTFDAAISRLADLAELGVTAIELMPVASFPGARNWGYDGVDLFAPQASYGGPEGLRRLVDAAHARGLGVILDVVYNHLGPEGNYLPAFTSGRYFTDRHKTPWGDAVNFDGPGSAPVREFVIQNALHWAYEYHVDGLRLDATHAIVDDSPVHVLAEMVTRVRESLPPGRCFEFIAEDERNERRVVTPRADGGWGFTGVWADDFHHAVRRLIAGDREAYFADYDGTVKEVATALRKGWLYEGQRSRNHGTPRGTPADGLPPTAFVHCIQNHDQVGNRAMGDRLHDAAPLAATRAAAAVLLLSPYTPMLWMGQEWAASAPFQYFTDHPEELGKRVTEGRRQEFGKFSAFADPAVRERIPDPQAEETFLRSKLDWNERGRMPHTGMLALHRALLHLRRTHPALRRRDRRSFAAAAVGDGALILRRTGDDGSALLLVAAFEGDVSIDLTSREETRAPDGAAWDVHLATEEGRFGGEMEGGLATLSSGGRLEMRGPGAVVLVGER